MNKNLINFLVALRNASLAKKKNLTLKKMQNFDVYASLLYQEGFILSYSMKKEINSNYEYLTINLRAFEDKSILESLKLLSIPSRRRIISHLQLSQMNLKNKLLVLSTSRGILSHTECLKIKTGGVVLFSC
jgi:ribosomal protein S8